MKIFDIGARQAVPGFWRKAKPEDLSAIARLQDKQEGLFSRIAPTVTVDRPQIFDPRNNAELLWHPFKAPVVNCMVFERGGRVVFFYITELVAQLSVFGDDREAMRALSAQLAQEVHYLKSLEVRSGWGVVPKVLAKQMARVLRGSPFSAWKNLELVGCLFHKKESKNGTR